MNNHWADVSHQLEQVLTHEQALRHAWRRQLPRLAKAAGQGWATWLVRWLGLRRVPTSSALRTTVPSL